MLIFIPMAGFGDRYKRAGHTMPKPLIQVDGVPMIERVIRCFDSDKHSSDKFLFCVNREHAETTEVMDVLQRLKPSAKIVVIDPHKDGPIRTLLDCEPNIPDDEEVILNYCDFGIDWSYEEFRAWLDTGRWDGAMTAYRGFHPHSLGPTLYAYMRSEGERVLEIREKHHFTPNKFDEYASSGLYYFRTGELLKAAARELLLHGERVNNEYYVSMAMQVMIEEKRSVGVFPLRHFYQWGTPEDLRDYESWAYAMREMDSFRTNIGRTTSRSVQVIPMAGRGQRFVDQGYRDPKPLITIAGPPMIAQALACLPMPNRRVLVAQKEHAKDPRLEEAVAPLRGLTTVIGLDRVTEGQACTARLGLEGIDLRMPVLFAPCDAGYVYDPDAWRSIEAREDLDCVVVAAKAHLPAIWRPQMYGWMHVRPNGRIAEVAVKKLIDGVPPSEQQVITGTFWFRDVGTYLREYESMVADDDRVNGEFYIDTIARRMVARGARVHALTVDKYIPWGTPEELRTFDYWNEVFREGRRLEVAAT